MHTPQSPLVEPIQKRLQMAFFIWIAITLSCGIFAVVPYISKASPATDTSSGINQTFIFVLMALGMAGGSIFLRSIIRSPERLQTILKKQMPANEDLRSEKSVQRVLNFWMSSNILCWALNESVATAGMAAALLTQQPSLALPFCLVGFGLNLAMRPDFTPARQVLGL